MNKAPETKFTLGLVANPANVIGDFIDLIDLSHKDSTPFVLRQESDSAWVLFERHSIFKVG
jgi:hypothetical protein